MNQPFYTFHTSNYTLRFDFTSVGKSTISKTIIYTKTDIPNFYTIALLDIYKDGSSDDTSVSDNGDMEKILITVFKTFSVFFHYRPDAVVGFEGSTPSRTRLYRIAISHELSNINKVYNVWGINSSIVQSFQKNQLYTGFLISLKSINIAQSE